MKSTFLALMLAVPAALAASAVQAKTIAAADTCVCRTEADWNSEAQNHGRLALSTVPAAICRCCARLRHAPP